MPQALFNLSAAGIKVWMLTGDKQETAINIGYACSLLDNDVQQEVINSDHFGTEEHMVKQLLYLESRYTLIFTYFR